MGSKLGMEMSEAWRMNNRKYQWSFKADFMGTRKWEVERLGQGGCLQNEILELRILKGSIIWLEIYKAEWNNGKSPWQSSQWGENYGCLVWM